MPLKAVFERAPLMPLQQVRLSYGQVRTKNAGLESLYKLCSEALETPSVLEGTFALACLIREKPTEEPVAEKISSYRKILAGDEVPPMSYLDQIACARAILALFEYSVRKEMLQDLLKWCAHLETQWEAMIADRNVRQDPADLMDFLIRLYRLTGKRVLLRMCTRLRAEGMDWTSVLNTFSQPRPLKRMMTLEEMYRHMEEENCDESGFYTRKALINRAETLSNGMRFARSCAIYGASSQDACEKAWEIISKQHGAVCGGTTADRLLEGTASHRGISAAALGAWAEALCGELLSGKTPWAAGEALKLYLNGMPATLWEGEIVPFQHVNELRTAPDTEGCFDPGDAEAHRIRCLARLARGWAALYHSAIGLNQNGLTVNLPLDGQYAVSLYDKICVLQIRGCKITLRSAEQVKGQIGITVPAELDGTDIRVNDESAYRAKGNTRVAFDRAWENGDVITLILPEEPRLVTGHHQGLSVYDGLRLMVMPADQRHYAKAICGKPFRDDDKILVPVKTVKEWPITDTSRLNDVQVLPRTVGNPENVELVPYATVLDRIALFPKG